MTEQEWLECNDPQPMLDYLQLAEKAKSRQLKLFAFGCCYRTWHLLSDKAKNLLAAADHFAEGSITRSQRDMAVSAFRQVHGRFGSHVPVLRAVYGSKDFEIDIFAAKMIAANAVAGVSRVGPPIFFADRIDQFPEVQAESASQAILLRDILGNPFRPVAFDPAWRTPNVTAIAQTIYEERRFADMPILADALEEAGCTSAEILDHCRNGKEHARGCWVVDWILEK